MNELNSAIKPRLCLTDGVTGHREHKLSGADMSAVTVAVERPLSRLQKAFGALAKQHHSALSSDAPEFRMVSALADGADTIVAKAALAAG